jgi:tetratricopeptide (TPR) repeat protein
MSTESTEAWQIETQLPSLRAEQRHDLAAALAERLLELREEALGAAHPRTLEALRALVEDYARLDRRDRVAELLERVAAAEEADPEALAATLNHLAAVLAVDEATRPKAIEGLRRALAILAESSSLLLVPTLLNLGRLLFAGDEGEEAEVLARRALDLSRARAEEPLLLAEALTLLSEIAEAREDWEEALDCMPEILEIHARAEDPADQVIADFTRIVELWLAAEEPRHAAEVLKKAVVYAIDARGEEHPAVSHLIFLGAKVALAKKQYPLAARKLGQALPLLEKAHGRLSPRLVGPLLTLYEAHLGAAQYGKAEAAARWMGEIHAATYPPDDEHRGVASMLLGDAAMKRKAHAEALAHYEVGLTVAERAFGPEDARLQKVLDCAGEAALMAGDLDRAEALTLRLLALHEEEGGPDDPALAGPMSRLVRIYMEMKDPRAGEWLHRMLPLVQTMTKDMQAETAQLTAKAARERGES